MILKRLALVCFASSLASVAFAQTLTVGSASVAAGGTANITVSFASGATAAAGVQLDLLFLRPPGVASGNVVATPGAITGAGTPTCAGNAVSTATGTLIRTGFSTSASPAAAVGVPGGQVACTFAIPTSAAAAVGNYPFTIDLQEFTNPAGVKFAGTVVNGSITITPAGAAANVAQSPATIPFGASNIGVATATQNLVLTNTTATAGSVTCTIGGVNAADFSFFPAVPGGTVALAANATVNVPVRFTPSAAGARGGSIACVGVGTTTVTGSPTALTGSGNPPPVVASITPNLLGGTAAAPATLTIANTTNQAVGTVVNVTGLTITGAGFVAPATGSWGACTYSTDATPPAATTSDTTAFTAGAQLVFNAANNGTAQAQVIGGTRRVGQVSAILTCPVLPVGTAPAATANVYRLVLAAGVAPVAVVTASQPSGTNILASNQVGSPAVNAIPAVTFTNTVVGSTPGSITCSIAAPANGWTVTPAGAQSVANGTPVAFTFAFAAPAVGAQNAVATCSGTGLAAPVTYNLNGTGTAVPVVSLVTQVPTLSTLSIWLLVASMLGFGLVMVGRRQS